MTMHRLVSRLSSPTPQKSEHTPKSWSKQPMALLICGQTRYRELISCARDTGHQPSSLSLSHSHLITSHACACYRGCWVGPTSPPCLVVLPCLIPTNSPAPNPFTCRGIEPLSISHCPQGKAISKMVIKIKKDVKTPPNSSSRASSIIPIVVPRNQFDSSKTRAGINVKAGSGGEVKLRPSMPVASMPGAS